MKIHDLNVKTVDTEKLINFLSIPLKENEKLSIDSFAIYGSQYEIDIDCCFCEIENAHFENKIQPVISIPCRIRKYNGDGGYSIRMDRADFIKTISLEDYLNLAKEVKLTDFIRYDYNPRIQGNQNLLMKYIKGTKSSL